MLHDAFAFYDPEQSSWRMSQGSLLPDSMTSSVDWPRAGTTRNGIAYRRQPSALRTSAIEFSLSHYATRPNLFPGKTLWPTPLNRDYKDTGDLSNLRQCDTLPRVAQDQERKSGLPMRGQLNPEFVEWLMGFPVGWTDLEHSETP